MKNEFVLDLLGHISCNCRIVGERHAECMKCLVQRETEMLVEERDRLRGSLAAYEAELARVERELSAKNI
jgi:hypothetical protein